jgi:hypothetical protein
VYCAHCVRLSGTFTVPAGDERGAIANGAPVSGSVPRGDIDQWTFSAHPGAAISVSVSVNGTVTGFFPDISVCDPDGVLAAFCDTNNVGGGPQLQPLHRGIHFEEDPARIPSGVAHSDLVDQAGRYLLQQVGGSAHLIQNPASPLRSVDTRSASGVIASGTSRCGPIAGIQDIPSEAAAVVMNVTAAGYGTRGWVTVYPNGQPVPATSTLNFDPSEYAMDNGTIVRVGKCWPGVRCRQYRQLGAVLFSDDSGRHWLSHRHRARADARLTTPQRLVDTRTSAGPIASGQSRCFTVAGLAVIQGTAVAVVLDVTTVGCGARGWIMAYPSGQSVPAASTLNLDTSEYAIANGAVIPLGPDGKVCINVGTINLVPGNSEVSLGVVGYL